MFRICSSVRFPLSRALMHVSQTWLLLKSSLRKSEVKWNTNYFLRCHKNLCRRVIPYNKHACQALITISARTYNPDQFAPWITVQNLLFARPEQYCPSTPPYWVHNSHYHILIISMDIATKCPLGKAKKSFINNIREQMIYRKRGAEEQHLTLESWKDQTLIGFFSLSTWLRWLS